MTAQQKYEVCDEVIGGPKSAVKQHGIITKTKEVCLFFASGLEPKDPTGRVYIVRCDDGRARAYYGEANLSLVKRAASASAPV